jgi:hypothetical protein
VLAPPPPRRLAPDKHYDMPWTRIARDVGTRTSAQCIAKWYSGYGDRLMGRGHSDASDLDLVNSIWDQDPGDPAGGVLGLGS